jgi:hypothetical protein
MQLKSLFSLTSAAFAIVLAGSSAATADVILPVPGNCGTVAGTNCLIFDDFTVYSLALLNFQAGAGQVGPGDPFAVSTNGMALQNALVVGTGVNGAGSINSDVLPGGVTDDAYNTPNSQGSGLTNFVMDSTNQGAQGGLIPGNTSGTWDILVSALKNYLNGGSLNFFFNLNQTNSNVTTYLDNPEDALGWLAVTLRDSTGNNGSVTFYLDGNACNGTIGDPLSANCDSTQSYPQNNANNSILPADSNHDEWAYIHGEICVSDAGALLGFGSCQSLGMAGNTVKQNLGANDAAFALYSNTLQTALNSGLYDVMSIDMRMAALDNGYEQLLIFAGNAIPQEVPEPITLTLFGAGLAGVVLLRRRRAKKA